MENESNVITDLNIIDELLAQGSKLNLNKNQKKINDLLEQMLAYLTSSQNLKLKNLDQNQIWSLIEKYSNNIINNYKNLTNDTEGLDKKLKKEYKETKQNLQKNLLKNKRERNDKQEEGIEDENANEEVDADEDAEIDEGEEGDEGELNDDGFFDMNEFNNIGDDFDIDKDVGEDDEELEEEEELMEGGEDGEAKYDDFFDKPAKKTGKGNEEDDEVNDEEIENNIFDIEDKMYNKDTDGLQENYDYINENVTQTIDEIEQKMMDKKKWHMKGEVTSKQRPKNSLLENYLDFQVSIKPPPIPTEEYSETIEKLIRMRIKDDLFDDPVRKETVSLNKKTNQIELDFEKSKKGLGELYEEDYSKKVLKVASEGEEAAVKNEVDQLCTKLYNIFDKLTNNSFVSGVRNTEMKVITNIPSIQLEEISQFVTDNTGATQSTNELYSRRDMVTKTKDENTVGENKADHKKWKRNVRNKIHQKEKNKKLNNLMKQFDSKFEAKVAMKQERDKKAKKNVKNSELKSSKFFGNLQNIVSDDINKKNTKAAKLQEMNIGKTAKQFKL
jgi:U3 small nucleolar RNA-associated protein MPP10